MPVSAMKARNFKLPSAARFINKEGRDDFRKTAPSRAVTSLIPMIGI